MLCICYHNFLKRKEGRKGKKKTCNSSENGNYCPAVKVELKHHRPGGFPGGAVVENLAANARDTGSSPGPGRPHMPRSN